GRAGREEGTRRRDHEHDADADVRARERRGREVARGTSRRADLVPGGLRLGGQRLGEGLHAPDPRRLGARPSGSVVGPVRDRRTAPTRSRHGTPHEPRPGSCGTPPRAGTSCTPGQRTRRRYVATAHAWATTRIPTSHASASQMSEPTGCPASSARRGSTTAVTGWFSANHATAVGMVSVGTNAELTNGRKIRG